MAIDVGGSIRAEVSCLLSPGSEDVSLIIRYLLDPSVAEGFPDFSDLIGTGAYLEWHVLPFVEPRGPSAFVHV